MWVSTYLCSQAHPAGPHRCWPSKCLSHSLMGGSEVPPHLIGASSVAEHPFGCFSDNPLFLTMTGLTSLRGNKPKLNAWMETIKGTLASFIHLFWSWDSPYVLWLTLKCLECALPWAVSPDSLATCFFPWGVSNSLDHLPYLLKYFWVWISYLGKAKWRCDICKFSIKWKH